MPTVELSYKKDMKTEIRYIERKTDSSDRGLAWIARVGFSQSRRTIYFNDMGFLEIIEDLPIPEVDQFHREENS